MDETTDISSEYTVDFHRHCQGTILSVYGHQDDGRTTDIFQLANFVNFPSTWREDFFNRPENKTLTHDLKSVLELVDRVVGELKGSIPSDDELKVPFTLTFKDNHGSQIASKVLNPLSDVDTNYEFSGFGRDITLSIEGQQVSFNTMTQSQNEVLNVVLPRKTLKFIVDYGKDENDQDVFSDAGSVSLPMPNDLVVHIPGSLDKNVSEVMEVQVQDAQVGDAHVVDITPTPGASSYKFELSENASLNIDLSDYANIHSGILAFDVHVKNNSDHDILITDVQYKAPEGEEENENYFNAVLDLDDNSVPSGKTGVFKCIVDISERNIQIIKQCIIPRYVRDRMLSYSWRTITSADADAETIYDEYGDQTGQNVCQGNQNVREVALKNVKTIGRNSFSNCPNLATVQVPMVETINEGSFQDCPSLTSISLPKVETIKSNSFSGCTNLASVSFPSVKVIHGAFSGCTSLHEVNFPEGIVEIGGFSGTGLESVSIPKSVTELGAFSFIGCENLIEFNVDSDNQMYKSDNGMVLSKDGKTLYFGTNGEVTIPSGVTSIFTCAFSGRKNLTRVIIPTAVTEIGIEAFGNCSNLTSLTFISQSKVATICEMAFLGTGFTSFTCPVAVKTIKDGAFQDCKNLTTFTANGITNYNNIGVDVFNGCNQLNTVYLTGLAKARVQEWWVSWGIPEGVKINCSGGSSFTTSQ